MSERNAVGDHRAPRVGTAVREHRDHRREPVPGGVAPLIGSRTDGKSRDAAHASRIARQSIGEPRPPSWNARAPPPEAQKLTRLTSQRGEQYSGAEDADHVA